MAMKVKLTDQPGTSVTKKRVQTGGGIPDVWKVTNTDNTTTWRTQDPNTGMITGSVGPKGTFGDVVKTGGVKQQPQQPIALPQPAAVQPQQKPGVMEQIAEVGLTPAAAIGNLITQGLEIVTGNKYGRTTAKEMAQTTFGKVLGTATVGAGLALGGVAAGQAIGAAVPSVATATAVPQTAAGLKTVTTAGIMKNGLLVKAIKSKTLHYALAGFGVYQISTIPTSMRNDAEAALTSSVQSIDLITDSVKAGILGPDEALAQLVEIENQISSLERSAKMWSKANIKFWLGGAKDTYVDIENTKSNLQIKKQLLIRATFGGR